MIISTHELSGLFHWRRCGSMCNTYMDQLLKQRGAFYASIRKCFCYIAQWLLLSKCRSSIFYNCVLGCDHCDHDVFLFFGLPLVRWWIMTHERTMEKRIRIIFEASCCFFLFFPFLNFDGSLKQVDLKFSEQCQYFDLAVGSYKSECWRQLYVFLGGLYMIIQGWVTTIYYDDRNDAFQSIIFDSFSNNHGSEKKNTHFGGPSNSFSNIFQGSCCPLLIWEKEYISQPLGILAHRNWAW